MIHQTSNVKRQTSGNCWRLVQETRRAAGLPMPDQATWLTALVRNSAPAVRFVRLAAPQLYAIVALKTGEYVTHLGVVLSPREFLHDGGAGPQVERIEVWIPRIEGFYEFGDWPLPPAGYPIAAVGAPGSLVILTNPLTGACRTAWGDAQGGSVAQWLAREDVPAGAVCLLNGTPLSPEHWSYRPGPRDRLQVLIPIGNNNQMLGIMLMVMLAVVSYGVGAYVGGAAGLGMGAGWGAAASAGIMIGGSLLLNALLAPGVPDTTKDEVKSQWGEQTVQAQGGAVPKIYGDVRVHGNIIAHYSEQLGVEVHGGFLARMPEEHIRNVLVCFGEDPVEGFDESSLRINDVAIAELPGVAVEYRRGLLDQTATSKFATETPIEFFAGYVLDYETNTRTYTLPGVGYDDAEVTVLFTNGLWSLDQKKGTMKWQVSTLKVEAGDALTDTWQTILYRTETHNNTNPVRFNYRASGWVYPGLPGKQHYIGGAIFTITRAMQPRFRVTRIDPAYQGISWGGDCMIAEVRGILNEVFEHPGKVLLQISALPSKMLSGSLDVSIVVNGSILQRWDGAAWVLDAVKSRNPAWIDYDILTYPLISGDGDGTPYAVAKYRGVDPADLDVAGFLATETLADGQVPDGQGGAGLENRIEIGTVFGETSNAYDAVRRIGVTGRAGLDLRGNRVGLWCDRARVPVGLFGDGNWLKDSWEPDPIPQADRAAELEIVYYDRDNGDEQTPILVPDLDIDTTNRSSIDCACTRRRSEAWRTGRYNLARNRLLDLAGKFSTDIDGIIYEPGDVLYLQLPGRSWGGRLAAVDSGAGTVTLDQDVQTSANDVLIVQVRDSVTGVQAAGYRIVASRAGRVVTFSGAWVFPAGVTAAAAPDDPYLFGPAAILADTFEVLEVRPQAHLQFEFSVLRYAGGVYTVDDEESGLSIDSGLAVDPIPAGPPRPPTAAAIAGYLPPGIQTSGRAPEIEILGLDVTGDAATTIYWDAGLITIGASEYEIAAGSTTDEYVWFDPGAPDPLTLKTGAVWGGAGTYKMFANQAGRPDPFYAPLAALGIEISGLGVTGDGDDTIDWLAGQISYRGHDYSIGAGSTTDKYVWFDPEAADPLTLKTGAAWPEDPDIYKMFINTAGAATGLYGQASATEPVTVVDSTSLDLTVAGQQISGTVLPGGGFIDVTFDGGTSNVGLDTDFSFDAGYSL